MTGARDQVTRLLALAPYLQSRGGAQLSRVADDFGVSPQQILRDLKVLWMCGLPGLAPGDYIEIDFEALAEDPDGLVRIDNADFLSRPVRLSSSEAAALIVALRALRESAEESSREVIERTLAKLEEASATGGTHLEVHLPERAPDHEEHRRAVEQALQQDRQLALAYYVPTRDETTERTVDPIALIRRDGHDYLDAWCHRADGRRLFRLSRIHAATVLDTTRSAPDVVPRDLDQALFEPGPDDPVARVRLAPALRWFVDHHPVTAVRELEDGALEVELRFSDPMWLVRLALRLAPGLEVQHPPEVRMLVADTARSARALYGGA
ncbi:MAG TPA: WYL domain-containing protein [Marmoricola sp.]|nr:WYL domain-containing protein [Marmoricola sp.]